MSVEKSVKLDYTKIQYAHPTYRMNRILPQVGSQEVTITTAGGQESVFEIPTNVFNLPRSELSYTFRIPQVVGSYSYIFKDVQSHIRQIQLYNRSGVYLCDLNEAANYTKIVAKTDTELQDFETNDTQISYETENKSKGVSTQLQRNDYIHEADRLRLGFDAATNQIALAVDTGILSLTVNGGQALPNPLPFATGDEIEIDVGGAVGTVRYRITNPAVTPTTMQVNNLKGIAIAAGGYTFRRYRKDILYKRYDNTTSSIDGEPQYVEVSRIGSAAPANSGDLYGKVKLPLGLYKHTVLELDKDLYAGEILLLRIIWNASTRIYYTGASGSNPNLTVASATNNVSISKLQLFLATEMNRDIVSQLQNQVASSGMSMLIPYVHSYKTNLQGDSQSVSLRFNRGHGMRLKKIYHSLFNGIENVNTNYDNSNVISVDGTSKKITRFYTMLNNSRLQEFDVTPSEYEDYMLLKDKIKSSVLQNSDIYQYNWCWIDDFTENMDPEEKSIIMKRNNFEEGLDLTLEQKWDIYCTVVNAQYNHYSFAVTQKMLTVGPSGISVL